MKKNIQNMIEDVYRLSPMQEGILFETQYASDSELYFRQERYCIRGSLKVEVFKRAWQLVVDRHPILRTIFFWKEGEVPIQIIRKHLPIPWSEDDWQSDTHSEQEQRFEQFCLDDRTRGFHLEQGPLIRFSLIRITAESYYFLWSYHHILLDGWSAPLLLDEAMTSYYAYCTGQEPDLPQRRPYKEYIEWLQRQENTKVEQYWRALLQGFCYPTHLAIERTHILREQQPEYAHETHCLPSVLSSAIRFAAQQHKLTVNVLMQGAWALLLSTYSGEDDIIFGVTVSGRSIPLPGIASMVGLFINALPLRVKVDPHVTVVAWLQAIQEQQFQSLQYEQSPLVNIQKWSDIPKDQALFKSLFVFQNYPFEAPRCTTQDTLDLTPLDRIEYLNYPLTLTVIPGEEYSLIFSYQCDCFASQDIKRLLEQFQTVLEAIISNPLQRIGSISLLSFAEREQQLSEWNKTEAPYPQDRCIHELFEEQVQLRADRVALVWEESSLTYGELNQRANRLAWKLRGLGVRAEVRVGICLPRSVELVVAMLAVLKAGGAYVPLDPDYPAQRLTYMLQDAQVAVLLTQDSLQEKGGGSEPVICCLDRLERQLAQESREDLQLPLHPDNLAYIIYTSGSTGTPKGAMVSHAGLVNLSYFWEEAYQLRETITAHLQMASFSFDVFTADVVRALCTGAKLVMCPTEMVPLPDQLYALMARQAVDSADFVPAVLKFLLDYLEETNQSLQHMRFLTAGSDSWSFSDYERVEQLCSPQTPIVNSYGLTEATIDSVHWIKEQGALQENTNLVPIGRPIANTQLYILDAYYSPVPIGVPGELYVGGVGVGRGYFKRPELTAERFLPDPFSQKLGARLYRTGDLVRYLLDGTLEYLGRADYQVKIRGFRIELGEIEAILKLHPSVRDVVVLAREHTLGEKCLIAYIVLDSKQPVEIAELRNYLSKNLPKYMIPAYFVSLPVLPLTPNGKINHRMLPMPDKNSHRLENAYQAPQTPLEIKLVSIWEQVLNVAQVGIHDNIFEIGGNSLHIVRIVAKAAKLGITITVKQIFLHPTIFELVRALGQGQIIAEQDTLSGLVPVLAYHQSLLDRARMLEAHVNLYHLKMQSALASDSLARAVDALVQYHDSLRLVCAAPGSSYPLTIVPSLPVEEVYSRIDVSTISDEVLGEMIERQLQVLHLTSSNMQAGPLFKVLHFDAGMARPSRLIIVVHALIADVEACQTIIDDLLDAYKQEAQSHIIAFPSKGTSYRQWVERLSTYAQSEEVVDELGFWIEQSRRSIAPLPRDRNSGPNQVGTKCFVERELTAEETAVILQKAATRFNVRIDSIVLGTIMLAMKEWSKQSAVRFHVATHGRVPLFDDMDISRTVGAFVSCYPIVLDIGDAGEIDAVVQIIQSQLTQVPHQGVGYEILSALRRTSDADPLRSIGLPEIMFGYISKHEDDAERPRCDIIGPYTTETADIEMFRGSNISILIMPLLDRLFIQWSFSSNIYDIATIERLVDAMVATLRAIAARLED